MKFITLDLHLPSTLAFRLNIKSLQSVRIVVLELTLIAVKKKIIILSMMAVCSYLFANALPVINFSFSPAKTLEQIQMMLQWSVCILLLKLSHTKTKI